MSYITDLRVIDNLNIYNSIKNKNDVLTDAMNH